MAYVATDPVKANDIAAHSCEVLRIMRAATTKERLDEMYLGWVTYADQMRVCQQIRDHMLGAATEIAADIKARRVVRDPTGAN